MTSTLRSGIRQHPVVDNGSSEGGGTPMDYMDDFFLSSGDKYPSLMELPFAIHEIQWERAQAEKVYLQGKSNGLHEVSFEIDLWKLELPVKGNPKFLVHQVSGPWLELHKPRDFYLETVKVIFVAAYFLIFAKQRPHASKGSVWRYVRKECSAFKTKANEKDLAEAFLLLQSLVKSDPALESSPIIQKFYPTLFKKLGSQVSKGANTDGERPRPSVVKRETCSPPREPVSTGRACTPTAKDPSIENSFAMSDIVKSEASTLSARRMRDLSSFAVEADLPLSKRLKPVPVKFKLKPGRPRKKKWSRKGKKVEGDEDWVDEPDVCCFCDDGVEGSEKLICCDGRCMRSFHPTIDSGWANHCPSLGLTRAAVSVDSYICPNCAFEQHQCFACGKLGSSSTSTNLQEVFLCGAKQCRRFYHPDCVAKLLGPQGADNLACQIQLGLETFLCPLHKCASCDLDEDKRVPELCLIKCRRCPVAWHEKCLPLECEKQLWPIQGDQFVMYCGKHSIDPKLSTPKRDHIIFPSASKALFLQAGPCNDPAFAKDASCRPLSVVPAPENLIAGPRGFQGL